MDKLICYCFNYSECDIEQRLNRVNGYRHLKELRDALQREMNRIKNADGYLMQHRGRYRISTNYGIDSYYMATPSEYIFFANIKDCLGQYGDRSYQMIP